MNGTIPTTETGHRTVTERVLAEGERRGREQGLEQARRALIGHVRTLLGDAAAAKLGAIRDFDEVSARAVALLAGRR